MAEALERASCEWSTMGEIPAPTHAMRLVNGPAAAGAASSQHEPKQTQPGNQRHLACLSGRLRTARASLASLLLAKKSTIYGNILKQNKEL